MASLRKLIPDTCHINASCRACNGILTNRVQEQVCWNHVKHISIPRAVWKDPRPWVSPVGDCAICNEDLHNKFWTAVHSECADIVAAQEMLS